MLRVSTVANNMFSTLMFGFYRTYPTAQLKLKPEGIHFCFVEEELTKAKEQGSKLRLPVASFCMFLKLFQLTSRTTLARSRR